MVMYRNTFCALRKSIKEAGALGLKKHFLSGNNVHSQKILKNALLRSPEVILFNFNKVEKISCQIAHCDGNVLARDFIK